MSTTRHAAIRPAMNSQALNEAQRTAAAMLRVNRPAVYDGTNIVADDRARTRWYNDVRKAMDDHGVKGAAVQAFCDIAGVPD